ncbi:MAG: hypothetical protein EXR75_16925 [Myxococcales bacterium]|nr:hypothetical protein [Myxococcales bacterium]
MKRWLPHLGVALGLIIAVYALYFSESEEDRVRALLDRLELAVGVTEQDSNLLFRGAQIRKEFSEIFDSSVSVAVAELSGGSPGRAGLSELATGAPRMFATATLELDGLALTLDKTKKHALAVGTVVIRGTRHGGAAERIVREASLSIEEIEGDWRIVNVTIDSVDDLPGDARAK